MYYGKTPQSLLPSGFYGNNPNTYLGRYLAKYNQMAIMAKMKPETIKSLRATVNHHRKLSEFQKAPKVEQDEFINYFSLRIQGLEKVLVSPRSGYKENSGLGMSNNTTALVGISILIGSAYYGAKVGKKYKKEAIGATVGVLAPFAISAFVIAKGLGYFR